MGNRQHGARFGTAVANVGDLNMDGYEGKRCHHSARSLDAERHDVYSPSEISSSFITGAYSPGWTFGLPFRGFCDHTYN
jgi:hypothetical protein